MRFHFFMWKASDSLLPFLHSATRLSTVPFQSLSCTLVSWHSRQLRSTVQLASSGGVISIWLSTINLISPSKKPVIYTGVLANWSACFESELSTIHHSRSSHLPSNFLGMIADDLPLVWYGVFFLGFELLILGLATRSE